MTIATKVDPYVAKVFDTQTAWITTLSNDERVFQDDGRPDTEPSSAWERLGIHCRENNLYIKTMTLQNGTNVVTVGTNAEGFYFRHTAGGFMFEDATFSGMVAGTLDSDGALRVSHWTTPELIKEWTEERDPLKAGVSLISKSNNG